MPTVSADASTNNVSPSTVRSPVNVPLNTLNVSYTTISTISLTVAPLSRTTDVLDVAV